MELTGQQTSVNNLSSRLREMPASKHKMERDGGRHLASASGLHSHMHAHARVPT